MRNILISWSYVYVLLAMRGFIYIALFYSGNMKFFWGHVFDFVKFYTYLIILFFVKREKIITVIIFSCDIFVTCLHDLYNFVIFIVDTGKSIKESQNDLNKNI